MIKRKISKSIADNAPYEIWNAFIDLIATEDYKNLDQTQRKAKLVFLYDAEVQNGGHLQYFENRGIELIEETLAALKDIGAISQHKMLADASNKWLAVPRNEIERVEEYVEEALAGEFEEFDTKYYACDPSINDLLERFLEQNQAAFIEIV